MSGRRDSAYEWGTAENMKQDFGVRPGTTLPAHPFHPVGVRQSMTRHSPIDQRHLPAAVGTATSATYDNNPCSLRSPSCPVPACNGKEASARPAFGSDMRSGVTAMGVQQGMPTKTIDTSTRPSNRGEVPRSCRHSHICDFCKHPIFFAFT